MGYRRNKLNLDDFAKCLIATVVGVLIGSLIDDKYNLYHFVTSKNS